MGIFKTQVFSSSGLLLVLSRVNTPSICSKRELMEAGCLRILTIKKAPFFSFFRNL